MHQTLRVLGLEGAEECFDGRKALVWESDKLFT